MNWFTFAVAAWIVCGLEIGLRDAFQWGDSGIAPSFVLPFMVYIAMSTPTRQALVSAFLLGLVIDLTWEIGVQGQVTDATIIGPYALGYLLASYLVVQMRGMMIRRNPLTLVFLAFAASLVCHAVVTALLTIRSFYDPIVWRPGVQLVSRLGTSGFTIASALVLAFILLPATPLFGFHQQLPRRMIRRD